MFLCESGGRLSSMDAKPFEFWKPHLLDAQAGAWHRLRAALGNAIGPVPPINWNKRLTVTAGMAYFDRSIVSLSPKIFQVYPEGFILDIIPHELAHIAAFRAFKDTGHGQGWKRAMDALGITRKDRRCWSDESMLECREMFWRNK